MSWHKIKRKLEQPGRWCQGAAGSTHSRSFRAKAGEKSHQCPFRHLKREMQEFHGLTGSALVCGFERDDHVPAVLFGNVHHFLHRQERSFNSKRELTCSLKRKRRKWAAVKKASSKRSAELARRSPEGARTPYWSMMCPISDRVESACHMRRRRRKTREEAKGGG